MRREDLKRNLLDINAGVGYDSDDDVCNDEKNDMENLYNEHADDCGSNSDQTEHDARLTENVLYGKRLMKNGKAVVDGEPEFNDDDFYEPEILDIIHEKNTNKIRDLDMCSKQDDQIRECNDSLLCEVDPKHYDALIGKKRISCISSIIDESPVYTVSFEELPVILNWKVTVPPKGNDEKLQGKFIFWYLQCTVQRCFLDYCFKPVDYAHLIERHAGAKYNLAVNHEHRVLGECNTQYACHYQCCLLTDEKISVATSRFNVCMYNGSETVSFVCFFARGKAKIDGELNTLICTETEREEKLIHDSVETKVKPYKGFKKPRFVSYTTIEMYNKFKYCQKKETRYDTIIDSLKQMGSVQFSLDEVHGSTILLTLFYRGALKHITVYDIGPEVHNYTVELLQDVRTQSNFLNALEEHVTPTTTKKQLLDIVLNGATNEHMFFLRLSNFERMYTTLMDVYGKPTVCKSRVLQIRKIHKMFETMNKNVNEIKTRTSIMEWFVHFVQFWALRGRYIIQDEFNSSPYEKQLDASEFAKFEKYWGTNTLEETGIKSRIDMLVVIGKMKMGKSTFFEHLFSETTKAGEPDCEILKMSGRLDAKKYKAPDIANKLLLLMDDVNIDHECEETSKGLFSAQSVSLSTKHMLETTTCLPVIMLCNPGTSTETLLNLRYKGRYVLVDLGDFSFLPKVKAMSFADNVALNTRRGLDLFKLHYDDLDLVN